MYRRNKYCLLSILLFGLFSNLFSQFNEFEYNNDQLTESTKINPAFIPKHRFYFQTSLNSQFFSNNLNINTIFNSKESQFEIVNKLINDSSIEKLNLNTNLNLDVFSIGFKFNKKLFLGLSSGIKFNQQINIDKNIIGLIYLGNGDSHYFQKPTRIDLNNNHLKVIHQNRLSVGYKISDKISVGLGISLINALYRIKTNYSYVDITTNFNDNSIYEIRSKSNVNIETNGFNSFNSIINPEDLILFRSPANLSTLIDFGTTVRLNKNFRLSACINNIGKINWSNNYINHSIESVDINYKGLNLPLPYNTPNNLLIDSLYEWFNYSAIPAENTLFESLPVGMVLGFEFLPSNHNSFLYLFSKNNQLFIQNTIHSVYYRFNLKNVIFGSLGVNFSKITNYTPTLISGVNVQFGPLQIYTNITNPLILTNPNSIFSMGVNSGVSVILGKQKDKDGDGIPNKLDKCPNEFGSTKNHGCPEFHKFKQNLIIQ